MSNIELPDYNKYLRYHAYAMLRKLVVAEVDAAEDDRVSGSQLCNITRLCGQELKSKMPGHGISLGDDLETLIAKKLEYNQIQTYCKYVDEACGVYCDEFESLTLPSTAVVHKMMTSAVDMFKDSLLSID